MKLDGNWKAIGIMAERQKDLIIRGNILEQHTIYDKTLINEFTLEPCEEYKSIAKEIEYIKLEGKNGRPDCIVHIEECDGHDVRIISFTTMEYDGRGLIVIREFIHEDDIEYIPADFESKLYDRLNNRQSIPMMNPFMLGNQPNMPAMGMMGMMGMMGNMNNMGNAESTGMKKNEAPQEEWKCLCGHVNVGGRFCAECGMPKA